MRIAIIIPARYTSSRLPGKVLLAETGKPLVQHTYELADAVARQVQMDVDYEFEIAVATDDQRIVDAVNAFGGRAVMTPTDLPTGSDRVYAALESLGLLDEGIDAVLNLQADEPLIPVTTLADLLSRVDDINNIGGDGGPDILTLGVPLVSLPGGERLESNSVKVVCSATGRALYFSRAPIPYVTGSVQPVHFTNCYRHIGVYLFDTDTFVDLYSVPAQAPLERAESLEQLRALYRDYAVEVRPVAVSADPASPLIFGVNTQEDYDRFVAWVAAPQTAT